MLCNFSCSAALVIWDSAIIWYHLVSPSSCEIQRLVIDYQIYQPLDHVPSRVLATKRLALVDSCRQGSIFNLSRFLISVSSAWVLSCVATWCWQHVGQHVATSFTPSHDRHAKVWNALEAQLQRTSPRRRSRKVQRIYALPKAQSTVRQMICDSMLWMLHWKCSSVQFSMAFFHWNGILSLFFAHFTSHAFCDSECHDFCIQVSAFVAWPTTRSQAPFWSLAIYIIYI